jgi:hypothetical protein
LKRTDKEYAVYDRVHFRQHKQILRSHRNGLGSLALVFTSFLCNFSEKQIIEHS